MNAVCAIKLFTSKIYAQRTNRVFVPTAVDALDFLMVVMFICFNVYFYNNSRTINELLSFADASTAFKVFSANCSMEHMYNANF